MEKFKLYGGKIEIGFTKSNHSFWRDSKRVSDSVTGATGIVDKSRPLMHWATHEEGASILETIGVVPKGYFSITDDDEKKRRWKELLADIKNKEIATSAFELATIVLNGIGQYKIYKKKEADLGTLIHKWVSDWILKKKPEMPKDPRAVNGITAFLKFQKERKVKWTESERVVYWAEYKEKNTGEIITISKYLKLSEKKKADYELYREYAGFLDSMGTMGKDLWLLDFKSSKAIYPPMHFQVAGYQIAWEEEMRRKIDRRMILKFGKNTGEFEAKELPKSEEKADKKAFLSCLDIKRRVKALDTYNKN